MKHLFVVLVLALTSCSLQSTDVSNQNGSNPCHLVPEAVAHARALSGKEGTALPKCLLADKEHFLQIATKLIDQDVNASDLEFQEQMFKAMGLIPPNYDYRGCIKEAYTSEASAFFAPSLNTIVIPNWFEVPMAIIVHEANHFLQQEIQNYEGDDRFRGWFNDAALSLGAVLEGDALLVEERFINMSTEKESDLELPEEGRLRPRRSSCELPKAISNLFYFQYDQGALFWQRLNKFAPEINRETVLKDPPRYSREIIDPKQYLARISYNGPEQEAASLCDQHEGTPELLSRVRFGEYILRQVLEVELSRDKSFHAARGLQDDCFLVFEVTNGKESFRWILHVPLQKDRIELLEVLTLRYSMEEVLVRSSSNGQIVIDFLIY